jgi:signal transduction histidine kinase
VGLVVVVVGLVEVQSILHGIRSHRRLRHRVVGDARERVQAELPAIAAALGRDGPPGWDAAAALALSSSLAAEVEVFDESARPLLSRPTPAPVAHWPKPAEREELRGPGLLCVAVQSGPALRVLSYVPFSSQGRALLLRLSTPAPDLEEDLHERQRVLIGHLAALSVLLLAGALAALPLGPPASAPASRALDAYEQAMERLRDRGEEMSREHQAERRRMAEEIRDKEALARAGELAAGIVHEVRNGLGTILGYARLLERGPADAAEAGQRIREECETLETVVRRFMDFVKRETLDQAPFDLGRMLSRVVAREFRGRSGTRVVLEGADAGSLVGDEELLERAFENLVRNAAEAAGPGGHVWIRAAREGDAARITVADDGPGMPPEQMASQRPFYSTKPGGLGLGLPIALKIVRLHGGELGLAERPPRGLAVTVRLPGHGQEGEYGVTIGSETVGRGRRDGADGKTDNRRRIKE